MKKYLLIIICILSFGDSYSQNLQWLENIAYSDVQSSAGTVIDKNGNEYNAGTYSPGYHTSGPSGVYLNKYDSNGNVLWADTSNGAAPCFGIALDNNDNLYFLGHFYETINFGSYTLNNSNWQPTLYLIKYMSNGSIAWIKQIPFTKAKAINSDNSGNIYVIGGSFTTGTSFISKYDSLGNSIWMTDLGIINAEYLTWNSTTGYVVCKDWTQKTIKKIDSSGNIIWSQNFPKDIINIASDKNGKCYVTGYFHGTATFGSTTLNGSGAGGYGAYICKLDSLGQFDLVISADDTGGYAIDIDSSGNIYTACPTKQEFKISKYDSYGNYQFIVSVPSIDTNNWYCPNQIKISTMGDVFISGRTQGQGAIAFLAKISMSIPTAINEVQNSSILNVFPNPAKETFQVCYASTEKTKLQFNIVNSIGEIIHSETIPAFKGEFNRTINLSNKPKGVYFVEIVADKKKSVKKIVLN